MVYHSGLVDIMRASVLIAVTCLIVLTPLTGASAEQSYNNLLLDGSYIRFNSDGLNPEVLIRIPYFDKVVRIQGGEELRFPMSNYYDVKVPLSYRLTKRLSAQVVASIERIYSFQSPFDMATNNSPGIPLNSMFGFGPSHNTQQLLCVFGLSFTF
jgi:hypothetical protein